MHVLMHTRVYIRRHTPAYTYMYFQHRRYHGMNCSVCVVMTMAGGFGSWHTGSWTSRPWLCSIV